MIDRIIGICDKIPQWPSILHDAGYHVQLIEHTISLRTAEKIKPDVIAVSNKHIHALVTDCKSGSNITPEQDKRYGQLTPDVLSNLVTVYDRSRLTHNFCYVDLETNHARLSFHTDFPFITFGTEYLQGKGDFGNDTINKALNQKISLEGMREPTSYYPFAHDDDKRYIAPYVLREVVSYLKERIDHKISLHDQNIADEMLSRIHKYHKIMDREHRKHLVHVIWEMLCEFMQNSKFRECAEKIYEGKDSVATLQSMTTICEEISD